MARLTPLPLRFVSPKWAADVPSPPHDALDAQGRRAHVHQHPQSFLAVTKSLEDAEPGVDSHQLLADGRAALERLLADGVFGSMTSPAYRVYQLEHNGHRQTGIVAGVSVDDYDNGVVRVHERVHRDRARHLAEHLQVVGVQSAPIAIAFSDRGEQADAAAVMAEVTAGQTPFLDITGSDGLRQQLWTVEDDQHRIRVERALSTAPLYLIDGHHRAAAASEHHRGHRRGQGNDEPSQWVLATLFPLSELRSRAIHRVLVGVDVARLIGAIEDRFPTRNTSDPAVVVAREPHELALAIGGQDRSIAAGPRWMLFSVADLAGGTPNPLESTDPVRLSASVLNPILGIDESGGDHRLRYRPGDADAAGIVTASGEGELVFVMRPIENQTLVDVSERGLVMPPKSTYFVPKVRAGLMLRSM